MVSIGWDFSIASPSTTTYTFLYGLRASINLDESGEESKITVLILLPSEKMPILSSSINQNSFQTADAIRG